MWLDIGWHELRFNIEEFEAITALLCVGDTDQNKFISDEHKDKLVEDVYFQMVDSKDFNNYLQGKALWNITFEYLRSEIRGKEKNNVVIGSKKGTESCKLYEFPLALQLWFYECIPSLDEYVCELMGCDDPCKLNWKSSHSPHYEGLETNVFESKE
ncbi:hypothetical protein PanWU01x14_185030, partial [Parasponia andersonii]